MLSRLQGAGIAVVHTTIGLLHIKLHTLVAACGTGSRLAATASLISIVTSPSQAYLAVTGMYAADRAIQILTIWLIRN